MAFLERYPHLIVPSVVFLLSFFLSVHIVPLVRMCAVRCRLLDKPGKRKLQSEPIPTLGGVAIVLALVLSLIFTWLIAPELSGAHDESVRIILIVGIGIAVVGVFDDLLGVPAILKLVVLAIGCVILVNHDIGLRRFGVPGLDYFLTFLWVAGIASAFNAIDNADGLAATACLLSAFAMFVLGWATWQVQFSLLAMGLAGSVLGFLRYNWAPARIYMGDSGSFFLGYILAVLTIFGEWSESPNRAFLCGSLLIGLPVYDLTLTSVLRVRHGVVRSIGGIISYSDTDHLSHRLIYMGFSHKKMIIILSFIATMFAYTALYIRSAGLFSSLWLLSSVTFFLIIFGIHIDHCSSKPDLWRMKDIDGKDKD